MAQGPLTIAAGSLVNRGNVSSNADISLKTAGLDNDAGVIGANGKLAVEGSSVTNRGGSLQAKQGVDLQAGSGSVDNSGGLMRSDGTVNVQAASLRNDNTQGQNQGMEGATVSVAAADISNRQGAMRGDAITLTAGTRIDNSGGLISATNSASLTDAAPASRALVIDNSNGTVIAGQQTSVLAYSFKADNDINLIAAQKTDEQHSDRSSSSWGVGVTAQFGTKTQFGFTANAAGSRGNSDGKDVSNVMTQVRAGGQVNIDSGRDTNLIGATVSGDKVVANVGRDLNIASVQDTSTFKSRDQSIGGSATIGVPGASISASRSRVDADYASVGQQAGITAGDGGFQINVKGNTDLKGAQIASTDKAVEQGKNSLTTGTLTSSDIQNRSQYSAESQSASAGMSGGKPGGGLGWGSASGSEASVTRSGVAGGAVTITDAQAQQAKTGQSPDQVVASLDTSVRTGKDSSNSLTKNWDGNQLREDVEAQAKITQAFGQQAAKMVGTYADQKEKELRLAAIKAAQDGDQAQSDALSAEAEKWKEGGAYRAGAHSAIGLLAGGVSGALGAAASSALMPDIAEQIKKLGLPAEVESAVSLAAAAGIGAAVGGGAGAASAFNVDLNNRQLHEDKIAKEKTLAKQLAEKSSGRYSVEEIEDALRVAENKALGEDILKGAVIKLDGKTTAADLSDVKGMVLVTDSQGNRYLVQTGLQKFPSRELQEFISSNTGSTYSWDNAVTSGTNINQNASMSVSENNGSLTCAQFRAAQNGGAFSSARQRQCAACRTGTARVDCAGPGPMARGGQPVPGAGGKSPVRSSAFLDQPVARYPRPGNLAGSARAALAGAAHRAFAGAGLAPRP